MLHYNKECCCGRFTKLISQQICAAALKTGDAELVYAIQHFKALWGKVSVRLLKN